jgi:aspartate 1-decarboxylase
MLKMMRAKIHKARITEANLNYAGSITIDQTLLNAVGMFPMEEVDIWNITCGSRLATYVIPGKPDSGVICLNGAAARLVQPDDHVIICAYTFLDGPVSESVEHISRVVIPDQNNGVGKRITYRTVLTPEGTYDFSEITPGSERQIEGRM